RHPSQPPWTFRVSLRPASGPDAVGGPQLDAHAVTRISRTPRAPWGRGGRGAAGALARDRRPRGAPGRGSPSPAARGWPTRIAGIVGWRGGGGGDEPPPAGPAGRGRRRSGIQAPSPPPDTRCWR